MSGETLITIVGNLTADASLTFTPSGHAVSNWTVASTPRSFDKAKGEWVDGDPLFMGCSLWRMPAENAAETLKRGMRVIVTGRLKQRSYEKDGQKRTVVELEVDEVGPSLKYAQATVTKMSSGSNRSAGRTSNGGARSTQHDAAWDTPKDDSDQPPF